MLSVPPPYILEKRKLISEENWPAFGHRANWLAEQQWNPGFQCSSSPTIPFLEKRGFHLPYRSLSLAKMSFVAELGQLISLLGKCPWVFHKIKCT